MTHTSCTKHYRQELHTEGRLHCSQKVRVRVRVRLHIGFMACIIIILYIYTYIFKCLKLIAQFGQQHRKPCGSATDLQTLCCGFNPCRVLIFFFIVFLIKDKSFLKKICKSSTLILKNSNHK